MADFNDPVRGKNANADFIQPENTETKLHREYNLLRDGLASGFVSRAEDAKDHPALSSLEIIGSAAVGASFTWMRAMGGRPAAVAKAGAYLLTAMAGVDVATRVVPSIGAMSDTWQSGDNFEANKNVIATKLGSALFDYPLMAASGRLGSYGATAGREFVVSKFSDASLRSAAPLLTSQIPLKEQSLSSKIGASETNAASERTLSIDDVLSGRNEPSVNGYYDPSTQRLFMFTGNSVDRTALLGAEKARNLYPIVPLSTSDLQKKIEQKK